MFLVLVAIVRIRTSCFVIPEHINTCTCLLSIISVRLFYHIYYSEYILQNTNTLKFSCIKLYVHVYIKYSSYNYNNDYCS